VVWSDQKGQGGEFSGTTGMVKVQPGDSINNRWSFDIDASGFKPGEYIRVTAAHQDVTSSATLIIVRQMMQSPAPTRVVVTPVVIPTTMATYTPENMPTTKVAPLPFWLIITGIAITGTIIRTKMQDKL